MSTNYSKTNDKRQGLQYFLPETLKVDYDLDLQMRHVMCSESSAIEVLVHERYPITGRRTPVSIHSQRKN